MARYIIKSSGHRELFNVQKFQRSLRRVGARPHLIEQLTTEVLNTPELNTTYKIYTYAYDHLQGISRPTAARYSLKYALYELGPTGFIFERFIGEIFKSRGYKVQVDIILQGACVDHEIDLSLEKDGEHYLVECKFHNRAGMKTDVRDALYTKARFEDLAVPLSTNKELFKGVWLATNTQFTSKAIAYGNCSGVALLGWAYPENEGIASLIDTLGLHPITGITYLNASQKRMLLDSSIILCRDLIQRPEILKRIHLGQIKHEQVLDECKALCATSRV
jgi:hypothetical protein